MDRITGHEVRLRPRKSSGADEAAQVRLSVRFAELEISDYSFSQNLTHVLELEGNEHRDHPVQMFGVFVPDYQHPQRGTATAFNERQPFE